MNMRTVGRIAKAAAFGTFGLAAVSAASSLVAGWLLVRPGKRRDYDCVPRIRHGRLEPIALQSSDGVRLHAWVLLSPAARQQRWVIVLHGYRSDRAVLHVRARFFARRGYNVMLLHFRGHGGSEASRISYGYHERRDVEAAFNFIRSLTPGSKVPIAIDGISMGAAAAAYAVGLCAIDPCWIIMESCYDNIRHALANRLALRVGHSLTPWFAFPIELVVEHLVRLRAEDLDPAKALENCRCPILIMAGDSERVLRLVEIEYLYGCVPHPKKLVLFPGADHQDLLLFDYRRYARAFESFLHENPSAGLEPSPLPLPDLRPASGAGAA